MLHAVDFASVTLQCITNYSAFKCDWQLKPFLLHKFIQVQAYDWSKKRLKLDQFLSKDTHTYSATLKSKIANCKILLI